ncbi:uncharacterized protein LOC142224760 [Haematobia irritans]|uniref:uncharacterized protein LOC142224760 n=1 Tax=Haematobia irritans TaxID=7368 RepID=UPI003F4F40EA
MLVMIFGAAGKLVLRSIWRRDVRWDEPIPELKNISNYRLPRFYCPYGMIEKLQLHVFVDASEEAFAAVAYWRFEVADGTICVSCICSTIKYSPSKKVSIPRLELQAAVLWVRVKQNVQRNHNFLSENIILWSDSKTVLKWISSKHRAYKPYVAHRMD